MCVLRYMCEPQRMTFRSHFCCGIQGLNSGLQVCAPSPFTQWAILLVLGSFLIQFVRLPAWLLACFPALELYEYGACPHVLLGLHCPTARRFHSVFEFEGPLSRAVCCPGGVSPLLCGTEVPFSFVFLLCWSSDSEPCNTRQVLCTQLVCSPYPALLRVVVRLLWVQGQPELQEERPCFSPKKQKKFVYKLMCVKDMEYFHF